MIDIFKSPVIRTEDHTEVHFTVGDDITAARHSGNFIYAGNDIVSLSTMNLANRVSVDVVKSSVLTSGASAIMSLGETTRLPDAPAILWGCQIGSPLVDSRHDIRALTGPVSYKNLGLAPGFMFDSRVLFSWCFRTKRSKPAFRIGMIPGFQDTAFLDMTDELIKNGIVIRRPDSHILTQLDLISQSSLFLTSSLSAYIMADTIGVPVFFFHRGHDYETKRAILEDYFSGMERETPDILDFSRSMSVSSFPKTDSVSKDYVLDKIRQYLDISPFAIRPDVFSDIKEYFDAL